MKKLALYLLLLLTACTLQAQELYNYSATVTRVYDGDTVWCDIDLGFSITLHDIKIRLYGVNTPEVRTKNLLEKEAGIYVKNLVSEALLGKKVILTTIKDSKSKYGEYLGVLKAQGVNVNSFLTSNGYAHKYYGKTKVPFTAKELKEMLK